VEDGCFLFIHLHLNVILSRNFKYFCSVSNLILNVDVMKFITKNSAHSKLHIGYKEKYIERDSEYKISWFTN